MLSFYLNVFSYSYTGFVAMHFVCVGACVQLQYAVCISLHSSLLLVLVLVVVFYVFVWFATKVHYFI